MTADDIRDTVRRVLAQQSPDYYAFPNASAFVAEGLDPADVADVLVELHAAGELEREMLEVAIVREVEGEAVMERGEPVAGGYRLAPQNSKPANKPRRRST